MSEELKPCPFCGGKAELRRYGDSAYYYIECTQCEVGAYFYNTDNDAIAAWNMRTEAENNTRLIAAAPKMYELLKEELIPTSDYGGILSFAREAKIRAVLARIDGEEVLV